MNFRLQAFWVVACLVMVVTCFPQLNKDMKIIRDERIHPEGGAFSVDFETENGIQISEAGNENLVRTGVIRYPLPNGETFILKYVADATGFKPESPFLPVAPVFPHPIPAHSLRQIERARLERLNQNTI